MRKPFAITLDVGVEPGRPHRRLAHRAPGLRAQPAAVQQRIPRRREHPAVAVRRGRRSREVRGCLGASEAVVVYRRTRVKMPAHDIEVEEALEEGGLPGAGPRPERRSVRPAERARRYLLRQRGRGRPRPDDRHQGIFAGGDMVPSEPPAATRSITTTARAAACASPNAPQAPSRWSPSLP